MLAGKVEPIDTDMRGMVRLASAIALESDSLSAERRAALKVRVLRRLDVTPQRTLAERFGALASVVARPLPIASRAAVVVLLLVSLAGGATAASANALPDDPLYGVKLSSERMRLDLAQHLSDRAAVELTIAESRLWEAAALAAQSRDAEADAAVSEFGEHLASAAALLEEARPGPSSTLVEQLRARLAQQQERFLSDAQHVASNTSASTAVTVLTEITSSIASGEITAAAKIADVAARGAEHAASNAWRRVPADSPGATSARPRSDQTRAAASADPGAAARELPKTLREKIEAVAKAAKEAAKRAREAAERARMAAQRSGAP